MSSHRVHAPTPQESHHQELAAAEEAAASEADQEQRQIDAAEHYHGIVDPAETLLANINKLLADTALSSEVIR